MSLLGGCACGAIRYESSGLPVAMVKCHCRDCQRAGGAGYAPTVVVRAGGFKLLEGQPKYYCRATDSGAIARRAFCGDCGAPLFASSSARPEFVAVRAGSLDDPTAFTPQAEVWAASAQPWDHLSPDIPCFAKGRPRDATVAIAPIEIVPYDSAWPARFESEKAVLLDVFRSVSVQIEHVGSTAVPGLGAKPVIDILLGVDHLADVEARISDLAARGYEYVQRYEAAFPERRLFAKPRQRPRAFHLHAVERSTAFWRRLLLFRDVLRRRPEVAVEYGELKQRLAVEFGADRDGYADAKTAFIDAVLEMGGILTR